MLHGRLDAVDRQELDVRTLDHLRRVIPKRITQAVRTVIVSRDRAHQAAHRDDAPGLGRVHQRDVPHEAGHPRLRAGALVARVGSDEHVRHAIDQVPETIGTVGVAKRSPGAVSTHPAQELAIALGLAFGQVALEQRRVQLVELTLPFLV